ITATGAAGIQGIYVRGGSLTDRRTWQPAGIPYVVDCAGVSVAGGGGLTIDPGAIVKLRTCPPNNVATITVSGGSASSTANLTVNGTLDYPVTFTSDRDDSVGGDTNGDGAATIPAPGDWEAIHFGSYSSGSLTYADVRYGGSGSYYGYDGAIYADGTSSTLAVTQS